MLSAEEARGLLDGIDLSTLASLRFRAQIGVLVFSFARITAAVSMRVADYYTLGRRSFFRLHEKGVGTTWCRCTTWRRSTWARISRQRSWGDRAMTRATALRMIKRRVRQARLPAEICAHSFRGTGIMEYLRNGGDLEVAVRIAGHESTCITQLYNWVQDEISLDGIERIHI